MCMFGACTFVRTLSVRAHSLARVVVKMLTLIYIGTTISNIRVALVASAAVADVSRTIGRVEAETVGAYAGVPLLPCLLAGGAVADGPVEDHRHLPAPGVLAQCPLEVGGVEGVMFFLRHKRIIAGAEVDLVGVVVAHEGHPVVGEVRRNVYVAAAYPGAGTVHRALGVVAVAEAAGELGVRRAFAGALVRLAREVARGFAAQDKEVVLGVGDAVHAPFVEL